MSHRCLARECTGEASYCADLLPESPVERKLPDFLTA